MRSLLIVVLQACAALTIAGRLAAQDTVTISGTIQHRLSDSVVLSYNDNRIAYYPREYYALLDKKGNFAITFTVPSDVYVEANLVHGNKIAELVLHGGDKLHLNVDAAHFDSSLTYEGTGSSVANFVQKHAHERGRMNGYTIKVKTAINRGPAEFLKEIEEDKEQEMRFLDKYKDKEALPGPFVNYWRAYYRYYNYFFIQQYPQVHELIKRRSYTDTVPQENYAVLKQMPDAFNDTFLEVPSYLLYLTGVFDVRLKSSGYDHPGLDETMRRKVEDSLLALGYKALPPGSAAYFVAQNIYGRIRYQDVDRTEHQLTTFRKRWPRSEYLALLESELATAKRLAKGQPAPDFDIVSADGKRQKLSDLKGTVVYITFWASWCRQCVAEMVNGNRMKTLFSNRPVTFVYLSIDEDTTVAHKMVRQYKTDGIFADVKGGWGANEVQQYGVQRLPAYFLVDQDGKFALTHPPSPVDATKLSVEISKLVR